MRSRLDQDQLHPAWAVALSIAYVVCALAALHYTQNEAGIAHVWPSSGIAAAGLLLLKGRSRSWLLVGIAAGSYLANVVFGASPWTAFAFTIANLAEGLLVSRLADTGDTRSLSFDQPSWVLRYTLAALLASMLSGLLATLLGAPQSSYDFFVSWTVTVLLGILLIGPVTVYTVRLAKNYISGKRPQPIAVLRVAAVIAISGLVALATFSQSSLPVLFPTFIVVTYATFLLGIEGALVSVGVITAIGSWFTTQGLGPVAFVNGEHSRTLYFQFYLMMMLVSAMPLASMIADRARRLAELHDNRNLLQSAAEIANMGYWRYVLSDSTIEWSPEIYRIHGTEPDQAVTVQSAFEAYHPDDAPLVEQKLRDAIRDQKGFDFEARIITSAGAVRNISGRGHVEFVEGRVVALFGILIDVTERVALMQGLQDAREDAENKAKAARRAAETDDLTGVANRRKAMEFLAATIAVAERDKTTFSLILLDADHFKSINDTHGHAAGDSVLQEIAQACSACLRPSDLFARFGGEEFIAILPDADEQRAIAIAERLRAQVSKIADGKTGLDSISISLGVALYREGADATYLLQAADAALYQAKSSGRNRYRLAA